MLKFPTFSLALIAFALALAPACQAVFGDYQVDSSSQETRVCKVDEYRCTGEVLEVCAPNRSHWVPFDTCASADQCNLNSDSCRSCQAGVERLCVGATLFTCNASSQWEMATDCMSAALCSAAGGGCLAPACPTPGEHRCTEASLERCAADQSGWEKIATCASAADCNTAEADAQVAAGQPATCHVPCAPGSGACAAPTCTTPGTMRCVRDPLALERCSEQFQWRLQTVCRNYALCNADEGRCDLPQCAANERRCTKNTLEKCKNDLTGWAEVRTCAPNQLCDPAAALDAECVTGPCVSGQTRCNSLFVEQCNGASWERSERCAKPCDLATKACPP